MRKWLKHFCSFATCNAHSILYYARSLHETVHYFHFQVNFRLFSWRPGMERRWMLELNIGPSQWWCDGSDCDVMVTRSWRGAAASRPPPGQKPETSRNATKISSTPYWSRSRRSGVGSLTRTNCGTLKIWLLLGNFKRTSKVTKRIQINWNSTKKVKSGLNGKFDNELNIFCAHPL